MPNCFNCIGVSSPYLVSFILIISYVGAQFSCPQKVIPNPNSGSPKFDSGIFDQGSYLYSGGRSFPGVEPFVRFTSMSSNQGYFWQKTSSTDAVSCAVVTDPYITTLFTLIGDVFGKTMWSRLDYDAYSSCTCSNVTYPNVVSAFGYAALMPCPALYFNTVVQNFNGTAPIPQLWNDNVTFACTYVVRSPSNDTQQGNQQAATSYIATKNGLQGDPLEYSYLEIDHSTATGASSSVTVSLQSYLSNDSLFPPGIFDKPDYCKC